MIKNYFYALVGTVSVLALSSCGGGADPAPTVINNAPPPLAMTTPSPLLAAPSMSTTSSSFDVEARLARLETDVGGIKSQMSLVRPILEKMPALQDKLGELVTELQRIDARVAAAQAHIQALPPTPPTSVVPLDAPFKPMPKMAPIVEPAPKPITKAPVTKPTVVPPPAVKTVVTTATPVPAIAPLTPPTAPIITTPAAPTPAAYPARPSLAQVPVTAPVVTSVPASAAPVSTTPVSAVSPKPEPTAPVAPAGAPASQVLQQIRIAGDQDKTRLVLDVSSKSVFTYDLDNKEKVLMIDVAVPNSTAVSNATLQQVPLVGSYNVQSIEGGKTRVIVQLTEAVKILATSSLPPIGDKGERIVIDLAPEGGVISP